MHIIIHNNIIDKNKDIVTFNLKHFLTYHLYDILKKFNDIQPQHKIMIINVNKLCLRVIIDHIKNYNNIFEIFTTSELNDKLICVDSTNCLQQLINHYLQNDNINITGNYTYISYDSYDECALYDSNAIILDINGEIYENDDNLKKLLKCNKQIKYYVNRFGFGYGYDQDDTNLILKTSYTLINDITFLLDMAVEKSTVNHGYKLYMIDNQLNILNINTGDLTVTNKNQ